MNKLGFSLTMFTLIAGTANAAVVNNATEATLTPSIAIMVVTVALVAIGFKITQYKLKKVNKHLEDTFGERVL